MATIISLLKDFAGGQGAGAANYVTYADDLDTNFTDLENTVNQLVNEVKATLATNQLLTTDMLTINDESGTTEPEGVIGGHSYETSINGGDASQLLVQDGQVLVNQIRAANATTQTLQGSIALLGAGATNASSVIVDTSGLASVVLTSTLPIQGTLEIASVNWDGTAGGSGEFTGAVTQEAPIFFDGDDYAAQLARAAKGSGPVFPQKDHRTVAIRIDAIERVFAGVLTDLDGDTLGTPEFANDMSASRVELSADGSNAAPAIFFTSDPDLGIYRVGVDQLGLAAAQVVPDQLGAVGAPLYSVLGDLDSGVYFPGADRVALSSGGTRTFESTLEGHLDSPTQPRADFERSAVQSVTNSGALVVITFDTENTDVGAWGTVSTATITVPTGGDGFYWLSANAEFAADSTGERRIAITLNGAGTVLTNRQGQQRVNAAGAGTTYLDTSAGIDLASGDVLRLEVAHNGGAALDVTAGLSVVKLW